MEIAIKHDKARQEIADITERLQGETKQLKELGKSGSWLYHKLNGVDGNKKPIDFTTEERYQLKGALIDLSERIRRAADAID